jgi:hypothetical protein
MPSKTESLWSWEPQPNETAQNFAAFNAFRSLPPRERTLSKASLAYYGKNTPTCYRRIKGWSAKFEWVTRALAWDEEQERQVRQAEVRAVKEMRARHAKQAMLLQQKAVLRLQAMKPDELSPRTLLEYLSEAIKIERQARGEPDAVVQENVRQVSAQVMLDPNSGAEDINRAANILAILAESDALKQPAVGSLPTEADELYPAPTDAACNSVGLTIAG